MALGTGPWFSVVTVWLKKPPSPKSERLRNSLFAQVAYLHTVCHDPDQGYLAKVNIRMELAIGPGATTHLRNIGFFLFLICKRLKVTTLYRSHQCTKMKM